MSEQLIGNTLAGRFVLEDMLGTGATGAVYRATQTAVDRVVAIKTLHPFLQEREDFKARFEIEAKAIARLNHPNCITLYDFGYDDEFDVFYMAVEYIEGELLADMMGETIPYEEVLSICYQIAEALEHAHREGILHRDLKPENIMIQRSSNSGRPMVKVLDFGLARLYETKLEAGEETPTGRYKQITQAGQVYGTPAYMSPEQCRAREGLTAATDLYALGTMMYELLEGRLPFISQSTAELILMQMTEDPPEMERIDVPDEIREMIHSMMSKDPEERPGSAKDVLVTLMPHVRLDASQEFRIVPSESGEHRALTDSQFRSAVSASMELSSDELRAANSSDRYLGVVVAGALIVGFLGALIFVSLSGDDDAAEAASVDSVPAHVADSLATGSESEEPGDEVDAEETVEETVEVAENDETTRARKPKKRPGKRKTPRQPESATDSDESDSKKSDENRPKTLKLTY